jgi:Flp pilus assembly protein TadG
MVKRIAIRRPLSLKFSRERGAILPLAAVAIPIVLGAMGLSIDVGNVFVARQELQAAANAAALKSAASLVLDPVTGQPDAQLVTANVTQALKNLQNTSNGQDVKTPEVSILGYNLSAPNSITGTFDPTQNQIPAVKVSITKNNQNGNGQVDAFFSKVLNVRYGAPTFFTPTASAIAIPGTAPSTAAPGQILPIAVPKSLMDALWDPTTNQPKTAKNTNPLYSNGPRQTLKEPYAVRVWDNDCGIPKTQTLTDSSRTEICKDDDHKTGAWHSYDSAQSYSYSNPGTITNEKEVSEKDDVYLCKTSDASRARQNVVSNTRTWQYRDTNIEPYAGYVAVVDSCAGSKTYSGTKTAIHAFAAVKILRSGSEDLCTSSSCKEKNRCGYVDIQLIRRGERQESVSNRNEFSPILKGHGVTQSEHSYVDGAPQLCHK